MINNLNTDASNKKLIEASWLNSIKIMESLCKRHEFYHNITNVLLIILSAIVPVILTYYPAKQINPSNATAEHSYEEIRTLAIFFSVMVAILHGIRQSYKFNERFKNFRKTAEELKVEGESYFALSDGYAGNTPNQALPLFISRIIKIRNQQIGDYIQRIVTEPEQDPNANDIYIKSAAPNPGKERANQNLMINREIESFIKSQANISDYKVDHDRKLITVFSADPEFKAPDIFQFENPLLKNIKYNITQQAA
jgi:hypothetical protein